MAQVPTGSLFFVATTYSTAKAMTAVSNAAEAVVTCAAHGYANGDTVQLTSGWGRLNGQYIEIKAVTTDSFTLVGFDTTDTARFVAGNGVGTVRKVTAFTEVQQAMNPSTSGGDAKSVTFRYVSQEIEQSINDGFGAVTNTLELDADAIGTTGYAALKTLSASQANTVLRTVLRSGSRILLPCTVAFNESPTMSDGKIISVKATFSGNQMVTRYA
jgi:hypothetical protein